MLCTARVANVERLPGPSCDADPRVNFGLASRPEYVTVIRLAHVRKQRVGLLDKYIQFTMVLIPILYRSGP